MLYKNFASLVIAGGATKVISAIGVMRFLEEQNMMKSIKNYVGTSAGAVLCAFAALGYTSKEMADFFVQNLCNDESINRMNLDDILSIFTTYGLSNGDNLMIFFRRMICKKLGQERENITFIELAKLCGRNLVVCVSNLSKERQEFWSVDTKPNVSVITALRASCAIPIIFTPVIIDGDIYIDGGLYDNFPIDYFKQNMLRDILGINIKTKGYQKIANFMEYIKFVIFSVIDKLSYKTIEDNKDANIISLDFEDDDWLSLLDMSIKIQAEKIHAYIDVGYRQISDKMSNMYIQF